MISYGKALGGGLPLSAAVGPAEIMNDPRGLTITTTAGNPVSAAAGRAVLRTIMAENLMANAAARGEELTLGLRQLANKHPLIGDVRGRGLVIGVELVQDRQSKRPATRACAKVAYRARELGVAGVLRRPALQRARADAADHAEQSRGAGRPPGSRASH